jgi:hypothetical protein
MHWDSHDSIGVAIPKHIAQYRSPAGSIVVKSIGPVTERLPFLILEPTR